MCSYKVSLLFHPGIKQFPTGTELPGTLPELMRNPQKSPSRRLADLRERESGRGWTALSNSFSPSYQWGHLSTLSVSWVGARGELEVCGLPSAGIGGVHFHRSALSVLHVLSHLVSRTTYNMVISILQTWPLRPRELNNLPKITQSFRGQNEISAPDFCISKAHA